MKFRETFRFELAYQRRRVSTWLFFAALTVFAFLVIRGVYVADARSGLHLLNAPFVIAGVTLFGGVIWLLLAGAVAGEAAARDVETRMDPLTYTAPVSKADYLGGRFFAAFVVNALILLGLPLGILLALLTPGVEPDLFGPFRPAAYLTAYVFIALPNAFVVTAIQFAWAVAARRGVAAYLASGFLLFISHFIMSAVASLLGQWELTKLLDFVGIIGIVSGELGTWTPIERNTRLMQLDGWLLANRLLWIGIALCALAFTYFRFHFHHSSPRAGWWSRLRARRFRRHSRKTDAPVSSALLAGRRPQNFGRFGFATYARQTLAIAWDSFRTIARSRGGLTLVAVLVPPAALFASAFMTFQGVPLLPRTEYLVGLLSPALTQLQHPWVIIPLLTVYYAGELVWREREAGLSEMADAAPIPEWALFLGKFLGLGFVIVAWLAFVIATGLLIQVDRGYANFEVGLYLRTIFGFQLANYLLFGVLVLAVHVLTNQKYLGHLVALVAYGLLAVASRFGVDHKLLLYAADSGWTYTDMRGFEPSFAPWLFFKLYWAAWAALLAVAARLSWVRGSARGLESRLQLARRRLTRPTAAVGAAAGALVLTLGGFIFYNTNVLNAYRSTSDTIEGRAEYERRYGQYKRIPQPRLTATTLHVEIYPKRRKADIRASYRLQNTSAAPIDSIHLATAAAAETSAVTFDRAATVAVADDRLRYRIYALEKPLQPGESLQLGFEIHFEPRGFRNSGADAAVVANGTYFKSQDWLPAIGYQQSREIGDAGSRRLYGLAPRLDVPPLDDVEARGAWSITERAAFDAVVGTDDDQTAVAPGALRREWREGGRRYFHYASDVPIGSGYAIFSANYAVTEGKWQDVSIQLFHHPGHAENVDRMMRSVRASLDYNSAHLGPYPYRSIKVVERPGGARGMHADAGTITYEEGFSLINPGDDPKAFDLPFFVVAHEVAHQWWGLQLAPARVEGAHLLDETLANYSALRVVEHVHGREQMRRVLGMWRAFYDVPRTRAAAPLLRATEPFLYRRKASLAMHALSEYIGADQVDAALRRLFAAHASGTPPLPTTLDLYRELQAVTPASLHSLLHDLFAANTFWELETTQATAVQTAEGTWQVTLDVRARKVVVDAAGIESDVPMDDWVEIGVFAPQEKGDEPDQPPYRQKHRLRSGEQTIVVTVPRKPTRAGVDPNDLLIDLKTDDNIKRVKIGS